MPMRYIALLITLAVTLAAAPVRAADELTEIGALVQQGSQAKALERIETYLAANPRDTRARFLKGVILTELGKNTEAIRMFSTLTKDFPDLPEPYNNLAVLYALEGDYERARATLETAIRKNPGYAIAYENLGDLHAKLASQAYEQSRKLDKANTSVQPKIDALRGMLKGVPVATRPAAQLAAVEPVAAGKPAAAKPPVVEPAPAAKPAAAKPPAIEPATIAAAPAAAKPAPAASQPQPAVSGEAGEVIAVLDDWARAWSRKDATAYLALYAPGFRVPGGATRAQWEALRRALIEKPRTIEVSISVPKVSIGKSGRAEVTFRQHYRSDRRDESDKKAMVLVRVDGKWLIAEERVVK